MTSPPTNPATTNPATTNPTLRRALHVSLVAVGFALAFAFRIPLCMFAVVTRHPCPGCGLTRAAYELSHGHIGAALHFHPLAIPLVPLVGIVVLQGSYTYIRHGRWTTFAFVQSRAITIGAGILMIAMLAVWIARFFGAFGGPVSV